MIKRVSTVHMTREAWLQARRHTIGGSDAAGIIGLSKYSTPFTVWGDKTGRLPDKEDTEAMRIGRDLEDYVAQRWCEATGKKVRRCRAMIYNDDYPHAHADVDRLVCGEDAVLECKTTSILDLREFNGVEFPVKYYAQCVHYLAVTGLKKCYLAVLAFGRGFFTCELERDEAEISALMEAENRFWDAYVIPDVPPTPDGSRATSDAIATIWQDSGAGRCELFGREAILDNYAELKARGKKLKEEIAALENVIKVDMGDAEAGSCGDYFVTWKPQERRTLQVQKLAAAHPEIDLGPFYKVTKTRPFTVKRQEAK